MVHAAASLYGWGDTGFWPEIESGTMLFYLAITENLG